MSPRHSLFLAAFLGGAATLHAIRPPPAEEPPKNTDPTAKVDPSTVPPYVLKKRSAFDTKTEVARAPFWPIGWVKRKAGVVINPTPQMPVAPKVVLDGKSFKVTSILLGSGTTPSLALINGRAYSEGEFVRMPKTPGTIPPRVRVQRINDGTVILQNGDQTLVASLLRPELNARKPEELLNEQDR